jgi:hypothetical protein
MDNKVRYYAACILNNLANHNIVNVHCIYEEGGIHALLDCLYDKTSRVARMSAMAIGRLAVDLNNRTLIEASDSIEKLLVVAIKSHSKYPREFGPLINTVMRFEAIFRLRTMDNLQVLMQIWSTVFMDNFKYGRVLAMEFWMRLVFDSEAAICLLSTDVQEMLLYKSNGLAFLCNGMETATFNCPTSKLAIRALLIFALDQMHTPRITFGILSHYGLKYLLPPKEQYLQT